MKTPYLILSYLFIKDIIYYARYFLVINDYLSSVLRYRVFRI